MEKIITDNPSEQLVVRWDGVRFAILTIKKDGRVGYAKDCILLNPKEMTDLIKFVMSLRWE